MVGSTALRRISCSTCGSEVTRDDGKIQETNLPHILVCGHSICGLCVKRAGATQSLMCTTCGIITTTESTMLKSLPLNAYLLGCSQMQQKSLTTRFLPSGATIHCPKKIKQPVKRNSGDLCCECNGKSGSEILRCLECDVPYCEQCFGKVHSFKALQSHTRVTGLAIMQSFSCKEHAEVKDFLYCETCSIYCCYICCFVSHKDHTYVEIKKKNEEFIPELTEALQQAEIVHQRLLRAKKESEKPALRQRGEVRGVDKMKKAVSQYMTQIHALLQMKEEEILSKLGMLELNLSVSLSETIERIDRSIDEVSRVVEAAKYAMRPEPRKRMDLSDVLEKVRSVANTPCFFVEENSSNEASVEFEENKTILDLISELRVVVKDGRKFSVVAEEDLPEGFDVNRVDEEVPVADDAKEDDSGSASDKASDRLSDISVASGEARLRSQQSSPGSAAGYAGRANVPKKIVSPAGRAGSLPEGPGGPGLPLAARTKTKQGLPKGPCPQPSDFFRRKGAKDGQDIAVSSLVPGDSIDVKVSWAASPADFYVQNVHCYSALHDLNMKLFRTETSGNLHPAEDNLTGSLYVVHIQGQIWSRVRLRPNRGAGDSASVEVRSVDTGVPRTVLKSNLRCCPLGAMSVPPFSVRCKLFDFHLEGGKKRTWEYFKNMTYKRIFRMDVMGVADGVLQVDLRFTETDPAAHVQAGQSLRDVLLLNYEGVFLEYPRVPREKRDLHNPLMPVSLQKNFAVGDKFTGVFAHAESLEDIYLQNGDSVVTRKILGALQNMNQVYSRGGTEDLIHSPTPGLLCAGLFSSDNSWYRAQVTKLCSEQNVRVRYIDYGNSEKVHWKNLRVLHAQFLKIPIPCLRCALVGAESASREDWMHFYEIALKSYLLEVEVVGKTEERLVVKVMVAIDGKMVDIREAPKDWTRDLSPSDTDFDVRSTRSSISSGTEGNIGSQDGMSDKRESKVKVTEETAVKAPENAAVKALDKAVVKAPEKALMKAPEMALVKAPEKALVRAPEKALVKVPEKAAVKAPKNEGEFAAKASEEPAPSEEDSAGSAEAGTSTAAEESTVTEKEEEGDSEGAVEPTEPKDEPEKPKDESKEPEDEPREPKDEPERPEGEPKGPEGEPERPEDEPERPEDEPERPEDEPERPEGEPKRPEDEPKEREHEPKRPEDKPMETEDKPKAIRLKVDLLAADSPSAILLMFAGLRNRLCALREDMKVYFHKEKPKENWEPTVGQLYAFRSVDNGWYRGKLNGFSHDKKTVDVFLIDWGRGETAPVENIRPLDQEFATIPLRGSMRCHLADISAPGGKDVWPASSKEFLAEQLKEHGNNLFMSVKGEVVDFSVPIILWAKKIVEDPLEPTREEWIALNKFLCEEGMALPLPGLKGDEYSYKVPFVEETYSDEYLDGLELPQESSRLEETDESVCTEEVGVEPEVGESVSSESVPSESWLPPLLVRGRFQAEVTYVDINCCIYVHQTKHSKRLAALSRALTEKFSGSVHDESIQWKPGQICVAKFYCDGLWYRAEVTEVVSSDEIAVTFVDYGNVERCKASELRVVNPRDFPLNILCVKCHLDGIAPCPPRCKYSEAEMDLFHARVVGKTCSVSVVRGPVDGGNHYMVDMTTEEGVPVPRFLLDEKFAIICTSTEPVSDFPSPPYSDYDSDEDVLVLSERECDAVPDASSEASQPELTSEFLLADSFGANATAISSDQPPASPPEVEEDAPSQVVSFEDLIGASIVSVVNRREATTEDQSGVEGTRDQGGGASGAAAIPEGSEAVTLPGDAIPTEDFILECFKYDADNRLMTPVEFLSDPICRPSEEAEEAELLTLASKKLENAPSETKSINAVLNMLQNMPKCEASASTRFRGGRGRGRTVGVLKID